MKRVLIWTLALVFVLLLPACGSSSGGASDAADYIALTADKNGNVVIATEQITTNAIYYNYDADGVTVQLVAIRDKDGKAHISFNTCQSCSPSPKAYYRQSGNVLQCENCGFTFAPEQVGIVHGGCNPWPIDGVSVEEGRIVIPVSSLDAMRPQFTSWGGPTK